MKPVKSKGKASPSFKKTPTWIKLSLKALKWVRMNAQRTGVPLTSAWFCKMLVFRIHTRKLLIYTHRSKRLAGKFCQGFHACHDCHGHLSSSTGTVGSCSLLCNNDRLIKEVYVVTNDLLPFIMHGPYLQNSLSIGPQLSNKVPTQFGDTG